MKDYSVDNGDVVILPAFGATIEEMRLLDEKSPDRRYHLPLGVKSGMQYSSPKLVKQVLFMESMHMKRLLPLLLSTST